MEIGLASIIIGIALDLWRGYTMKGNLATEISYLKNKN